MEYNQEYFEALLFEKVAGTISEDDNLIAEKAIADFPQVEALYQQLRLKMKRSGSEIFLSALDENDAWMDIAPRLERVENAESTESIENHGAKLFLTRHKPYWAAAALLLLGIPLIWLFSTFLRHSPLSASSTQESSTLSKAIHQEQVYLKTSDGKTVGLTNNQTIKMNGVTVQTKANALSYAAETAGTNEQATLYVPATKDYKLNLPDGTEVWMNSASTLRFPFKFDTKTREVYLTGEAYFKVAPEKGRQFIVHTDYADIRVHGTTFNVNAYEQNTFAASLVEGSVSAVKDKQVIQLKPDQQAAVAEKHLTVKAFDKQEVLSWRKGTWYFHNRSLAEISRVLNRWFDIKTVYSTPALAEQTFTGEIDKALPLNVVISNLELTSGIKSELKNGTLTFR